MSSTPEAKEKVSVFRSKKYDRFSKHNFVSGCVWVVGRGESRLSVGGAAWRVSRLLERILRPDYPTTAWTGPCVTHRLLCLLEVMDEGWLPACGVVVLVVPGHVPTIDRLNVDECFAIDAGTERRHRNRNEIVRVRTSMLGQGL